MLWSFILPCEDLRMMTYFASLVTKLSIPLLLSTTTVLMLPPSGFAQETTLPLTDRPSRSPSFVPTGVPSSTTIAPPSFPPAVLACQDTPNWRFYDFGFESEVRFCDDDEVDCTYTFGSITQDVYARDAPASEHCCKCKEGCDGLCDIVPTPALPPSNLAPVTSVPSAMTPTPTSYCYDTLGYSFCNNNKTKCNSARASEHCCKCKAACNGLCFTSPDFSQDGDKEKEGPSAVTYIVIGAVAVVCCITCVRANQRSMQMQQALSSTRQTMSERRRHRLQSDLSGSPTTPATPARDEQILIKFYFQRVLPDKSRTALETRAAIQSGEQEAMPPESPVLPDNGTAALESVQAGEQVGAPSPTLPISEDEENLAGNQNKNQGESPSSRSVLSQRLSSWRKASSSDECCICLDGYHPGETICAPITDKCNHVFHEECVMEWLRDHDLCPLCRVNLME
eukprot:scaffold125_cov109-Cylindrotheca_fusiformis.AAC.5